MWQMFRASAVDSSETSRLRALEHCLDPVSTRALADLEIEPGADCLEIGCGTGSIARWLADKVGAKGRVLAIDIDPDLFEGSPRNVTVARCDLRTDALSTRSYDIVHERLVLYLLGSARHTALRQILLAAKPGARVILESFDCSKQPGDTDLLRGALASILAPVRGVGIDLRWGRGLPTQLAKAGLVDIKVTRNAPSFAGGSPCASFWKQTLGLASAVAGPKGAPLFAKLLEDFDDPKQQFTSPDLVTATGQVPA